MPRKARTAAQRGKSNRQTGAAWERECAQLLRPWWPTLKRTSQASNGTGLPCPDLEPAPVWIECGKTSGPLTVAYYEEKLAQARNDRREARDRRPILLMLLCARQRWVGFEITFGESCCLLPMTHIGSVVDVHLDGS